MKIKKIIIFTLLLLLIPFINVKAEESISLTSQNTGYKDVIADIVGNTDTSKVTVYLFYQDGCPHCEAEMDFLDELKNKYDINILKFEVSKNSTNSSYMDQAKAKFMQDNDYVPFTVIGKKYFTGYSTYSSGDIEDAIKNYLGLGEPKEEKIEYKDVIADIVGNNDTSKVTVYFFHQDGCPHCAKEKEFLNKIKDKYDINILDFEVSKNSTNLEYINEAKAKFMVDGYSVPFTVIGTKYFIGYDSTYSEDMENIIKVYLGLEEQGDNDTKTLPLLGKVNLKKVSIPVVAVILGLIDGFNPCAMWILLFLISMLFHMKSRKRMWLLGLTFLFTSAFVYFLAMLGINSLFGIFNIKYIKLAIALVALIGGIINIRSFIVTKDTGCNVVDDNKRKKYFEKIKKFTTEKSIFLALIGVIVLAASVNLVELACSAGFPAIFIEILDLNNINGAGAIFYILIYILFFLLDDIIIFVIAMVTLEATGISTKYNRLSHLIGGVLMILIGILLILKPEWLMFNFK